VGLSLNRAVDMPLEPSLSQADIISQWLMLILVDDSNPAQGVTTSVT